MGADATTLAVIIINHEFIICEHDNAIRAMLAADITGFAQFCPPYRHHRPPGTGFSGTYFISDWRQEY
jgi:hypothetical protein